VKVRFYGKLREIFGEEMEIKEEIKSVEELAEFLVKKGCKNKKFERASHFFQKK